MSDKPILFSGAMVRALIAGTKTQTRRVLNAPKWAMPGCDFEIEDDGPYVVAAETGCTAKVPLRIAIGDRLYVRETWTHTGTGVWTIADTHMARDGAVAYQADGAIPGGKYWPSIHMPRRYSRITLTVTDVRVERLQDISEADANAEGIEASNVVRGDWRCYAMGPKPFSGAAPTVLSHGRGVVTSDPRHAYATLWTAINGPGSWEANPWVAAYSFSVAMGNIDQLARRA